MFSARVSVRVKVRVSVRFIVRFRHFQVKKSADPHVRTSAFYPWPYIILSGLYIKRFHTIFVSLCVPIAHYSVFDSMQLITALEMNMTIINPPARSSKFVYEFAYRELLTRRQLVLGLTVC